MLKGRARELRTSVAPPAQLRPTQKPQPPSLSQPRGGPTKPEPDYEVVEFPAEQYVNANLQPPPPPPPRPPTGHPAEAASCGLCGGGGARVRCAECGRRALCASCDDMYHRHPKRRHHQRLALTSTQLLDERPPLPPKVAPPVPPPRRHKLGNDRSSASPRPPTQTSTEPRRATLGTISASGISVHTATLPNHMSSGHQIASAPNDQLAPGHHIAAGRQIDMNQLVGQGKAHLGSMPAMQNVPIARPVMSMQQPNTLSHLAPSWARPRISPTFNMPSNIIAAEDWDARTSLSPNQAGGWAGMRRGASVLDLGGAVPTACACASPWRYGSCASLDHTWANPWAPSCCASPHPPHSPYHHHMNQMPQTPHAYRRAESRTMSRATSRAGSRAGSRAASPAMSVRSRASRRTKHRTPSPPPLSSSDADSESESDEPPPKPPTVTQSPPPSTHEEQPEDSLGPPPPPPDASWQCEHCTFVNESGVGVCMVCCKTPTAAPKIVAQVSSGVADLKITEKSPPPARTITNSPRVKQNGENTKKSAKSRMSTGSGPSPPRQEQVKAHRLMTPSREPATHVEKRRTERHDMAVGPSPPKEQNARTSPLRETRPNTNTKTSTEPPRKHSISVGPSPPRENGSGMMTRNSERNVQKKSIGCSPPRERLVESRRSSIKSTGVSTTGTSPPPQSISTQTYEVLSRRERASSVRSRRRFREDTRRERSQSRHSLSSDTKESTSGGRWEWREAGRDSSPGGEWSGSERRRGLLARRASHLDLRRLHPRPTSYYGSQADHELSLPVTTAGVTWSKRQAIRKTASPEPLAGQRALSLEGLSGGSRREAERGLELARLMGDAERLGFSAAEVQAALAQQPTAPLAWLRERWPSLCAGVRAAALRLAPRAPVSELDARAALARHRGAMWPAVTDCVDKYRHKSEALVVGEEGRLRGHVWGSPAGADDDAMPPDRTRAYQSSDESELPLAVPYVDDDWMYLPLDANTKNLYEPKMETWEKSSNSTTNTPTANSDNIAHKLKALLIQAGIPSIDENLLLKGLFADNTNIKLDQRVKVPSNNFENNMTQSTDLLQTENDFINVYNAMTSSSPLPHVETGVTKYPSTSESPKIFDSSSPNKLNNEDQTRTNNTMNNEYNEEVNPLKNVQNQLNEIEDVTIISRSHPNDNSSYKNPPQTSAMPQSNGVSDMHMARNKKDQDNNFPIIEQVDDKPSNLSDIVDHTQKLIQQMKEEINSDINSLDGNNAYRSDVEHSSNESDISTEHESSYSETDDRSDDMTSDDGESSYTNSSGRIEESSKHIENKVIRTSSEENEQFEEAMDHIEEQIEDVKQANIEMLNSIARSLQEEHSISIELRETPPQKPKRQDVNNNNFTKVNSFDEIYDEIKNENFTSNNTSNSVPIPVRALNIKDEILYDKHTLNITLFHQVSPVKLIITENKQPMLKAQIEEIEEPIILDKELNSAELNQDKLTETHSDATTEKRSYDIEHHEDDKNISNTDTQNSSNIIFTDEVKTFETLSEFVNDETDSNKNHLPDSDSLNIENILLESTDDNNFQSTTTENNNLQNIALNKKTNVIENRETTSELRQSNSKIISTIKSSIPKPVRIITMNKQRNDNKSGSKCIASKVPVRRGSIKLHPAPAPPKSHFGNVQSGHVKQLQNRLFDNKLKGLPRTTLADVKASTSTMGKKKSAPAPPIQTEINLEPKLRTPSPPKKEKRNFFRETCRTEDEWTETDSDISQEENLKLNNESSEPARVPSPPPPVTLRRVSGQLIDLANVRLPEGSPERQARMLLAEGAIESWEQAQIAVELVSQGAEPPAALLAALECADLPSAVAYLHQDCELCASKLPEHEMVSMLRCTHRCCRECARLYFTVQVTERSIADCVCPYCKEPELETLSEDAWLEYFAHLDIQLKTLLDNDVHELFQRKLRDRTLARDPNFRWCVECSSGFFVHPKQKKLRCPECRSVSCASCRKPWSSNHEGLSCEQYATWLEDNDPERSIVAVQQHLRENGLDCPRCHFKYSLSRGGCMHFTCTQCKYEFCYGCGKPFTMGARCGLSDYCAKLGLHAHHPRNCLFYLRDKEPHELQTLLQMNNVSYESEAGAGAGSRCPVQLQRETPAGLVDAPCGADVPPAHAGLCKAHYVEYLAGLARALDPIPIMSVPELAAELRRRALPLPERGPWDTDPIYAGMCAEIVRDKIPLE